MPDGNDFAQWLILQHGLDAGKKLFFYDRIVGRGPLLGCLVCVHGNPESSYTYRKVVAFLEASTQGAIRVIAMDHIGFGLSDQASFEMVEMHHAANMRELIDYLDIQSACLLIHDWGGAIGVGAFIEDDWRVRSLVIVNTTVFPIPSGGMQYTNFPLPGFMSWNRLAHWLPSRLWPWVPPFVMTSKAVNESAGNKLYFIVDTLRYVVRALVGKLSSKQRLYHEMFSCDINSRSSKRNAMQTHVWGHGYRYVDENLGEQDNHAFYQKIQGNIQSAWSGKISTRAYFGLNDVVAKKEVQEQWLEALPQLEGHIKSYPNRGHFLEEIEYEDIAAGVLDVLKETSNVAS